MKIIFCILNDTLVSKLPQLSPKNPNVFYFSILFLLLYCGNENTVFPNVVTDKIEK